MDSQENHSTLKSEFKSLEPSHQLRIRRTLQISAVWASFIFLTSFGFLLSRPYLNRKRKERMKQPGYKPRVTLKETAPYNLYGINEED